ncbi:hypothetical protein MHT86_02195 [Corynebacterium mastitidis]|uniref:Uncharacterized protein n=1 Tax=Corynebacterium mastitidis TaxID=161890 RepID=A0A2N0X6C0_9CORY|nr:hypothetical protein [Corynebacterium mastitidis]MCH6196310.1 hypothetical protein [Corynebacterium mastitidis]PKF68248.1 hypothetical protein CXB45_08160 [Corynebacterium mastitidis]
MISRSRLARLSYALSAAALLVVLAVALGAQNGPIDHAGYPLALGGAALVAGVAARSLRAGLLALAALFSPFLLFWAALLLAQVLYVLSLGHIAWI